MRPCLKSFILSLLAFLPVSPADAAPGGGGGTGIITTTPMLVDSTGKTVGRYISEQYNSGVLVSYNKQIFGLPLYADMNFNTGQFQSFGFNWVYSPTYFTTADCSGQIYIFNNYVTGYWAGEQALTVETNKNGGELLIVNYTTPTFMNFVSTWDPYQKICLPMTGSGPAFPVSSTVPLSIFGTPPFYVQ